MGAGLFVKSLDNVRAMRIGYDADPVLVATSNMRGAWLSDSASSQLGRTMLAAAQALPGVAYASRAMTVPLLFTNSANVYVPGVDSVARLGYITYQAASADYFRVMDTRIVRGRGFEETDREGAAPVAVVSTGMAKAVWPAEDAIGKCIRYSADAARCMTVVGIAEDIAQNDLTSSQRLHFYMPADQFRYGARTLLIRMHGDAGGQAESVRKALQAVMPGQAYVTVRALRDVVDGQRRSWRLGATMFVAFGLLALVVAAVGLYGVISYNVTQRMHELGVRVALGAQTTDVIRLITRQGLGFAVMGVAVGTALALAAAHWLQPLLFQQSAKDPLVYGVVGATMLFVALVASTVPAMRAAKADPNVALRSD